jgi:hypothetical protein
MDIYHIRNKKDHMLYFRDTGDIVPDLEAIRITKGDISVELEMGDIIDILFYLLEQDDTRTTKKT